MNSDDYFILYRRFLAPSRALMKLFGKRLGE
jgi:hypothetical protein